VTILSRLLEHLTGALRKGQSATLVTVVMAQGSGPRNPGAHMLVLLDGSIAGTVGGGELEWQAIEEAKSSQEAVWRKEFVLGPDLGQCCGGRMTLQFERCTPEQLPAWQAMLQNPEAFYWSVFDPDQSVVLRRSPSQAMLDSLKEELSLFHTIDTHSYLERFAEKRLPLFLFGAGHVGKALSMALASLPIKVTWLDSRVEVFPSVVPRSITTRTFSKASAELESLPQKSVVLVMTHDHSLDLDICSSALECEACSFVGLIGSGTKKARFIKRLTDVGISNDRLKRFHCPIGIEGITSKEPAAIAASVAAQLLQLREVVFGNSAIKTV